VNHGLSRIKIPIKSTLEFFRAPIPIFEAQIWNSVNILPGMQIVVLLSELRNTTSGVQ